MAPRLFSAPCFLFPQFLRAGTKVAIGQWDRVAREEPLPHRNLDFEIPLMREQWEQLGHAANFRPDYGVLRWMPHEWDVIRVSIRENDAPEGWTGAIPPDNGVPPEDREVARFVYNDGRPYAQLEVPPQPTTPAVLPQEEQAMTVALKRWVREKWHDLLRDSGIAYDRGALPPTEPEAPTA